MFQAGSNITDEIAAQYPKVIVKEDLSATLVNTVENAGNKIVIIIAEWDAPIRENPGIQAEYLGFLRSLLKNSGTTSRIFAAAYITGILPIKKDGSQSAISDFEEYSMLEPGTFAEYVRFTGAEVLKLCEERRQSFEKMKVWYDGYSVGLPPPTH